MRSVQKAVIAAMKQINNCKYNIGVWDTDDEISSNGSKAKH
jgi:hypothetical protein